MRGGGGLNVLPSSLRTPRGGRVPGKRGCPLCSASQPAGRTGSRSGRPQIITRVQTADLAARSSPGLFLGTIPLVSAALRQDPSWISRPGDGNAAARPSCGCTPRRVALSYTEKLDFEKFRKSGRIRKSWI